MKNNLIFLHGGPGFRDYLEPYFSDLSKDFNCVFYDQLQDADVRMDQPLEQLHSVASNIEGPIILVGYSWDGILAIEYAAMNPERINGLVLMSTGLCSEHWKEEYYKELKVLGLEDALPEDINLTPEERTIGKPLLDKTWASKETFESLALSYVPGYDLPPLLSIIRVPILNIFGERDVRFPKRVPLSFRAHNDKIIDIEIIEAGHFPFLRPQNRDHILAAIRAQFRS